VNNDMATAGVGAGGGAAVSRRGFLRRTGGAALIGIGTTLLTACQAVTRLSSSSSAPAPTTSTPPAPAASGFKYPSYVPFQGPRPDLPGSADGVSDAYFSYPRTLARSVANPPGQGGDVVILTNATAAPQPLEDSPAWQQINRELNVNLKFNLTLTSADAAQKLGAIVAGGDLPDVLFLGPTSGAAINSLPEFLAASCADLTPYLGGDAAKDYPNFANIPSYVWRGPGLVYDNKLYGLPTPRGRAGNQLNAHQEVLDQAGIGPITSADDFKRALQAANRPQANVYAIGDHNSFSYSRFLAAQTFGAPNNWKLESSGKLVKDYETDEFKAGLGFLRDLWATGLFHPNTLTFTNVSVSEAFWTGNIVFHTYPSLDWVNTLQRSPNARPVYVPPFSADGAVKPRQFLGPGNFGAAILKKGSPERIKEVLGVLNYMAAPFGTREKLLTTFGVLDTDFTFDAAGNPVATSKGFFTAPLPFMYVTQGPAATYAPVQSRDWATMVHTAEQTEIAEGVEDPTNGLFSRSDLSTGPSLRTAMADGIVAIVAGRQPLSDWEQMVSDWQTKGGNKIRDEYAAALQARAS
jgi:putative aldouronate transport system substrate-binding protein